MGTYECGCVVQNKNGDCFLYLKDYDLYLNDGSDLTKINKEPIEYKHMYISLNSMTNVADNNIDNEKDLIFRKHKKIDMQMVKSKDMIPGDRVNISFKGSLLTALKRDERTINLLRKIDKNNYTYIIDLLKSPNDVIFSFLYDEEEKKFVNKMFYRQAEIKKIYFNEMELTEEFLPQLFLNLNTRKYTKSIDNNKLVCSYESSVSLSFENFNPDIMFYINKLIADLDVKNNTINLK